MLKYIPALNVFEFSNQPNKMFNIYIKHFVRLIAEFKYIQYIEFQTNDFLTNELIAQNGMFSSLCNNNPNDKNTFIITSLQM